ncbi:zinc finger, CCHC-type containing protein [Tanacetum coccineum]
MLTWDNMNFMQNECSFNAESNSDPLALVVPIRWTLGRQISFAIGTSRTYTPGASGSNSGKQRTVICYNCKGEGHMSKQCTKPKRKRDDSCQEQNVGDRSSEQSNVVNHLETEIMSNSNIIPYSQYVTESQQAAVKFLTPSNNKMI